MALGNALRVLLRRWLVVLIGALLTLGAAGYLYLSAPPSYTAGARMLLLLPPDSRGADAVGSPFLFLPDGLNVIAELVSVSATTREFRAEMAAAGLNSAFEVDVDPQNPILAVEVVGPDPDNVLASRDWLVQALEAQLLSIQEAEGAPTTQIAHARVFAAEDVPAVVSGSRVREVLTAVAVGGVITLLAAFGIDRLVLTRRARRARTEELDDIAHGGETVRGVPWSVSS
jgi:capsular polysaccharide biosynthesis protein